MTKLFKKTHLYFSSVIIGIGLIVIGIFALVTAYGEGNNNQLLIWSVLVVMWAVFTISNIFLYKKELKKADDEDALHG